MANHTYTTVGCPITLMPDDPNPLWSNGNLHFTAHHVGWIVAGFCGMIGAVASFWLIKKHLEFYTKPTQQRYIVRILFMVPVYAGVSWLSYYWWKKAIYFQLIRDCYEAVVIASFFYLLLFYLGDTEEEHAEVFKHVEFDHWIWPLGSWRYRPSGPYFLIIMKWSIGQYWIFRPGCTLVAVITEFVGYYCLESWSPRFSHVWCSLLISISVTVAMYAILQFYSTMKEDLKEYKPILKFLAVKSVVFLTFWQESFLGVLVMAGVIKDANYWSAAEIQAGISALLSCFEMAIFGFLHVKCFSYLPYRPPSLDPTQRAFQKTLKRKAILDVLDFRDVLRELGIGSKQVAKKVIGKDIEKVEGPDHLRQVFGRSRITNPPNTSTKRDKAIVQLEKVEVEAELQRIRSLPRESLDARLRAPYDADEGACIPMVNTLPYRNASGEYRDPYHEVDDLDEGSSYSPPLIIGDVRQLPRAATGLLHPLPTPPLAADYQRVRIIPATEEEESWQRLVDGRHDGPGSFSRTASWVRRVFRRSSSTYVEHQTLPDFRSRPSFNREDGLEAIASQQGHYDYSPCPAESASARSSRPSLPTSTGSRGPPLPRHGLNMPSPLSPSRYPGFDERAYVDRMYALHAVAENVLSTPQLPEHPSTISKRLSQQPPTSAPSVSGSY